MEKTIMPVNMAIDKLEKVIPCKLDENKCNDIYNETKTCILLLADQIEGLTKFNINAPLTAIDAAVNELNSIIIKQYINDIKAFGEQTRKDMNWVFTESLSYNIDRAFYLFETLHYGNKEKSSIFITADKCVEIAGNPDFIPNLDNHALTLTGYVQLYGVYKGSNVYRIMDSSESFIIICYNDNYTLHYDNNSLSYERNIDKLTQAITYELKFNCAFIDENISHNNYLAIN